MKEVYTIEFFVDIFDGLCILYHTGSQSINTFDRLGERIRE